MCPALGGNFSCKKGTFARNAHKARRTGMFPGGGLANHTNSATGISR